jgi:hypothetical protein
MTTSLLIYTVPVRPGTDIILWDELFLFPIDTARLPCYQPSTQLLQPCVLLQFVTSNGFSSAL